MLAIRPFDSNSAESVSGLSPPSKKCASSPSKMPLNADMLYRANSNDSSGFKFDLMNVGAPSDTLRSPDKKSNTNWQSDLLGQIETFEKNFAQRKATLITSLKADLPSETRQQMVDSFLQDMEQRSLQVLKSQNYARSQVVTEAKSPAKKAASLPLFCEVAQTSPDKENSPLKKMGSLRKQSRKMANENSKSPLKAFDQEPSPQKKARRGSRKDENSMQVSPQKGSPLKMTVRNFGASPTKNVSPVKHISDLAAKPLSVFGQKPQEEPE